MPVFVGTVLRQPNHALIGGLLFALLLASVAGQLVVRRLGRAAMPAGLACLSLGSVLLGLGVLLKSLVPIAASVPLLGVGQGLVVGWGLAAINQLAPADRRGEVASTYFTLLYVGLTIPVIGTGLAADAFGLQPAGVAFSAAVAVVVAAVGVALRTRLAAGAPTGSSPTRLPERSPARGAAARSPRRQI
jgi:sugar phosphate permease